MADNTIPIAPTDDFDDNDSALGDDAMSNQTESCASSIYNYRIENGRYAIPSQYNSLPLGWWCLVVLGGPRDIFELALLRSNQTLRAVKGLEHRNKWAA